MKKKHAYLYRLTLIILITLLPLTFFTYFVWKSSFNELSKRNQTYYENLIHTFSDAFVAVLSDLKMQASEINVSSKDPKSAFWRGSESFSENEYWYYEAVQEMKGFVNYHVSGCGIYYYDMDCIITSGGTQTAHQYIRTTLNADETAPEIWSYFNPDHFQTGEFLFSTTNTSERCDGVFLVGYCTLMGKNQDRVLIFYVVDPYDFMDALSVAYSGGVHFYVLNEQRNRVFLAFGDASQSAFHPSDAETEQKIGGIMQKTLYEEAVGFLPLSFAMQITEDSPLKDISEFYNHMRYILFAEILILLFVCIAALYFAYRPVYKLTSELDYSDGDEFATIRSTLDDHNMKIQEQEMLILDLLLTHLIYGVPISENRIKRLGISSAIRYYCVFVLEGHVLLSAEVEQLTAEAEQNFRARLFVTDWQGKNRNILIAFLENQDISAMKEWFNTWMEEHIFDEYSFHTGEVVSKMDDIRSSLLSCFVKKNEQASDITEADKKIFKEEVKTLNSKKEQQENMKAEILSYLDVHYRDPDLSQTQVADAFHISNYTLSRMFKNQVGIGFTEYVNARRLEYARELLLTTTYPIREISVMSGFANDNYFSRLFKASTGMTPSAFREQ